MVEISAISVRSEVDELVVSAHILMPELEGEAWFRLPAAEGTDVEAAADAFFIIGLILAMGSNSDLTMDQPVSKRLVYNAQAVQDILLGWYPNRLHQARLNVSARKRDQMLIQERTVTCFTGGVDSFDTFIRNSEDVDALLYVHGFDIALSRTDVRAQTQAHLKDVAAVTGKELIEVSTNIRRFLNRAASWPVIAHGPALSSVGHLLSARYGQLLIPGSHTYADRYAWGSHPLTDHLWSSNRLSVVHDGAGFTRVEKTRKLAHDLVARRHLRVCWQNTGRYNCGKCDKCLRTMIALSLTGVLSDFETFESEVPLDAVRALKISGRSGRSFVLENLEYAEQQGNAEIAEVLRKLVGEVDTSKKLKSKAQTAPRPVTTPAASAAHLEKRLAAAEHTNRSIEKSLQNLEDLWPIRTWIRFSRWRHRSK